MIVTPCCQFLYTGAENGYLKMFSVQKSTLLKSFDKCHKAPITSMACTPNNKFIFTCCLNELKQWAIGGGKCLKNFAADLGADLAFNGICVSPDSRFLFSFDWDGEIKKWNISSRKVVASLPKCEQISGILVTQDLKSIFECDRAGKLFQIDIETDGSASQKGEWPVHDKIITSMCQLQEGGHVFTADMNGTVKEWSIEKAKTIKDWGEVVGQDDEKKVHQAAIFSIAVANLHTDPKSEPF